MSEQAESGITTLFDCVRKCDRVASPVIRDRERYVRKINSGLRSNLLVALQLIIERDGSIPMAPGQCAWTQEACERERHPHGPCLDHPADRVTEWEAMTETGQWQR